MSETESDFHRPTVTSRRSFRLFSLSANGMSHRIATVRGYPPFPPSSLETAAASRSNQPLVMLLHGWPECWYCWRHQLVALAEAGYPVCAPDMRGYGGTDSPPHVTDYAIETLCQDILQIAEKLDYSKIVLVGHDMGAYLSWNMALLCPKDVVAVCGMSVPYLGHTPRNESHMRRLQNRFGNCLPQQPYSASRNEQEAAQFHYMIQHNLPRVDEEYDRNSREALYRIFFYAPGVECYPNTPEVTDRSMFPPSHRYIQGSGQESNKDLLDARSAPGFWLRLPRPKALPNWMSNDDFEYVLTQYKTSGFGGGLKWYQALDLNWFRTSHFKGQKITQPALFLCGEEDHLVLKNHGGATTVKREISGHFEELTDAVFIPGAGHWIQQQCAGKVNFLLLDFLASVMNENATRSRL